jgi:2-C-methyl-D-erythritol 2,4-cyclodiphosphate synthase
VNLRIGHGVDIHQLEAGRKCVIGGVEIPSPIGPVAHSDGDVLIHALIDAILGAQGEADIGVKFPNTDQKYSGVSSQLLLEIVWNEAQIKGYSLINADICVVCEAPKLKPHTPAMKEALGKALGTSIDRIGIKATTAEKLGSLGRGEGIFASATVLLEKKT